jgi:hypothetical protein
MIDDHHVQAASTATLLLTATDGVLGTHSRYRGLRGRIVRAFQRLGYDETTLAIYDKALTDGDLLLRVLARPAERRGIAALLQRHHVHDVGYFGPGTLEQSPPSMRAEPDLPRNSWPLGRPVRPGPAPCPSAGSHPAIDGHSWRNPHCY